MTVWVCCESDVELSDLSSHPNFTVYGSGCLLTWDTVVESDGTTRRQGGGGRRDKSDVSESDRKKCGDERPRSGRWGETLNGSRTRKETEVKGSVVSGVPRLLFKVKVYSLVLAHSKILMRKRETDKVFEGNGWGTLGYLYISGCLLTCRGGETLTHLGRWDGRGLGLWSMIRTYHIYDMMV